MKRIAIAQWRQETNTFNPNPTELADYQRFGLTRDPEEIEQRYRDVDELGGFYAVLDTARDVEIVPLLRAVAWSGGALLSEAYEALTGLLLGQLDEAGPCDAVLLSLHGATAAVGEPDVCGAVVERVRQVVGSAPIGVSLDLHANITPRLIETADVVVGYHANPHIDMLETGARTARILLAMLAGEAQPVTALRKIPALIGAERQSTFDGPLGELFDLIRAHEQRAEVLNANVYPVQPWLDVPLLASATVVTTNGDATLADRLADELADGLWDRRDACGEERLPPAAVAARVAAATAGPVVISDGADSTNSGAPGDSTVLIRAFLEAGVPGPVLVSVVDPLASQACASAGIGAMVTVDIGGRLDPRTGPPVRLTGRVRTLSDGRYRVSGHGGDNVPVDAGPTAVLESGPLLVVLTSHTFIGGHPNVYRSVGLDPATARAVVAKSPHGFRHDYGPFAGEIVLADCPGAATGDYTNLRFTATEYPLHPLADVPDRHHGGIASLAVRPSR